MIKKLRFLVLAVILFTPIINANAELFLDAIVATINDKPITLSDINKKYNKHLTYDDLKNNLQASKIVDTSGNQVANKITLTLLDDGTYQLNIE